MDFENEIKKIDMELRSIKQSANVENALESSKRVDELLAKRSNLEKLNSIKEVPMETRSASSFGWSEIKEALMEKRAITSNGAGAVNVVQDIFRAFVDKNKMGSLISKYVGASASTVVPVFNPSMALPVGSAEGVTGVAGDGTAIFGPKSLLLKPYTNNIAISTMALQSTNLDKELPAIFADAYASAIDAQVLVGSGVGNAGLGVFVASASGVPVASDINCAGAGAPKIADLVKLAVEVSGSNAGDGVAIVMSPAIFGAILADATAGNDPFKYELMTQKVLGLPIILSNHAPSATVAGSYVVVGGNFKHYAMAYAAELNIKGIDTIGTDNITFQALQYMQFTPILGSSFRRLKTV